MKYFSDKLFYLLEKYNGEPILLDDVNALKICIYHGEIVGIVSFKKRLPSFFDCAIFDD